MSGAPEIRIVAGDPTDAEICALICALTLRAAAPPAERTGQIPPMPPSPRPPTVLTRGRPPTWVTTPSPPWPPLLPPSGAVYHVA
ncbi:acyl-CoA carboxylase epsilon subunit [Spongiactinospora sp. 9N601]|uniref:acyl-CoA carboxylase epsilon subunit n=1 Tax=Spongiactinospora sp. 9N601 TaxID=3375149 RepID=UPI0037ADB5E0